MAAPAKTGVSERLLPRSIRLKLPSSRVTCPSDKNTEIDDVCAGAPLLVVLSDSVVVRSWAVILASALNEVEFRLRSPWRVVRSGCAREGGVGLSENKGVEGVLGVGKVVAPSGGVRLGLLPVNWVPTLVLT